MTEHKYLAIYFRMGQYNEDDNISPELVGFDCPFEDSPVLYAQNEEELQEKIKKVYTGSLEKAVNLEVDRNWDGGDWESVYPNIICDSQGNLQIELYYKITGQRINPDKERYSFGKENLTQFWEREKWRWT